MESGKYVLILKAPSEEDGSEDPYKAKLEEFGWSCVILATLEFNFHNTEDLKKELEDKTLKYSGMILSSRRSVKAVELALSADNGQSLQLWKKRRIFVIGPATFKEAKERLDLNGVGADCGNAASLAQYIGNVYEKLATKGLLLFPCSSMKRDELPNTLTALGIPLHCLECYQSVPSNELELQMTDLFQVNGFPCIAIFFSPSGVRNALPILRRIIEKSKTAPRQIKILAIGPTTKAVIDSFRGTWFGDQADKSCGDVCYGCAKQPSPQGLLDCIEEIKSSEM